MKSARGTTRRITVSVCGSYNKHLKEIGKRIIQCRALGIRVLIPKYAIRQSSTHGFVYLKGEGGTPRDLQDRNFRAIARSTFMLVVNPGGYVGPSTSFEIGYAYANGVPIFLTDRPKDYVFRFFCKSRVPLREIRNLMNKGRRPRVVRDL